MYRDRPLSKGLLPKHCSRSCETLLETCEMLLEMCETLLGTCESVPPGLGGTGRCTFLLRWKKGMSYYVIILNTYIEESSSLICKRGREDALS